MDRFITAEDHFRGPGKPRQERALRGTAPALWAATFHWARRDVDPFIPRPVRKGGVVAVAVVNHGRWIVRCPFCSGAQFASRMDRRFFCVECLNERAGRAFIAVEWPKEAELIEKALIVRPDERTRNWEVGETVYDLWEENSRRGVS